MTTYVMTAEENYDSSRVTAIGALTTYAATIMCTDQNYQGVQWDPVRRNLMYMYQENIPSSPNTNATGHTLWDGQTAITAGGAIDTAQMFNSSVGVKNIDTGAVAFHLNYNVANIVPNGIGGGDGTWRRYTRDFHALSPTDGQNGPGMTDPYTGNFWVNSQSCPLYCFRLSDNYSQVISPLFPVHTATNMVRVVGFTDTGATNPWTFAREIEASTAYLYLTPREFTTAETTADKILIYATFTYPIADPAYFHIYNREIFDHAGNMYLFSCTRSGGKDFKLHKFAPPTSAPYGGPTVGGGFTDITPWASGTGPNADGSAYTGARPTVAGTIFSLETSDIIPLYLPYTDDLVLIEKFFSAEKDGSQNPALMFWSCTYVHDPSGTPTWDHQSAFVTGYMTSAWAPTDISGAAYAVIDAFEVNSYLGQSDYAYNMDYTKRWFFFLCTKMTSGVSDGKARIVLVEYQFIYGSAPTVVQVIDEQGWDDTYPTFDALDSDAYALFTGRPTVTAAVATAMQTGFNTDEHWSLWDVGIHDPVTNSFWWSGGATDNGYETAYFSQFDTAFADRMQSVTNVPSAGTLVAATPPFLKLSFSNPIGGDIGGGVGDVDLTRRLRVWGYSLDDHDKYVLRVGPSATLVYDLKTGQWSQWASPGRDNWRAHIGQNWVGMAKTTFDRGFGTDIVAGDDMTGVLWILDPTTGRDDRTTTGNDPYNHVVTGGIGVTGRDVIPCNAVQLSVSLGAPTQTGAAFTLETSDDAGNTWLTHETLAMTVGDYSQVMEWRSMGEITQPGRVFKITDNGAAMRITGLDMR